MFIWTISDAIGIALFVLFALAFAAVYFSLWWQQWRCKHQQGVNETSACDAICRGCGKTWGSSVRGVMPASKEQTMTEPTRPCGTCGMPCTPGEYHPYAACLMFKACHNSETVRANLEAVRATPQPTQAQAGAGPLTDEQSHALLHRMADECDKWADGLSYEPTREQASGWCVAFLMRELPAHGIKGGQHG